MAEDISLDKKNIVFVITGLRMGGAEMQLLLLSKTLVNIGYQVTVAVMRPDGVLKSSFLEAGVKVVDLNIRGVLSLFTGWRKLRNILMSQSPFIVHAHMIHANLFTRLLRLTTKVQKLVCTAHNISEGGPFIMGLYKLTDHLSDIDTNVSVEALEEYFRAGYFSADKSRFVPNAIDTKRFLYSPIVRDRMRISLLIPSSTFIFLAVGRLHAQKDYPNMLEAFKKFLDSGGAGKLLIVGEGVELESLQSLVMYYDISTHVQFLGRRSDVADLMSMADTFVLSSAFEGFGLVVAEALSSSLPVVATDCGGVKEVLGRNGILVPPKNAERLSDGMLAYYKRGQIRDSEGREHVLQQFSIDQIIQIWLNLYKNEI